MNNIKLVDIKNNNENINNEMTNQERNLSVVKDRDTMLTECKIFVDFSWRSYRQTKSMQIVTRTNTDGVWNRPGFEEDYVNSEISRATTEARFLLKKY